MPGLPKEWGFLPLSVKLCQYLGMETENALTEYLLAKGHSPENILVVLEHFVADKPRAEPPVQHLDILLDFDAFMKQKT